MTKTTFAEIDSEVNTLITKQLARQAMPKKVKDELDQISKVVIAGFPVVDPERKRMTIERHIRQVKEYANARAALITSLEEIGIKPLATLPVEMWNNICDETKLL